ncbi:MAG: alpha/beta fold hydrolase, partial [Arenicellales bacterium]|nr:alpha/beta fold hydrolase [Arenicellales bacterium]
MVATVYFLLLLAFGYGALAIFLYFYQPRLLYLPGLPTRELVATPKQIGLEYQEIRITTQDDVALSGWFLPHQQPRATLLFLHGNAGNISHRLESLDIFHHLGLAVLIIDYRGYGQSSGRPSEEGTYQDAAAALRYLGQRGVPPDRVVVFGRSLGAPIA